MTPFDPSHARSFLISFYIRSFSILCVAIMRLKYAIGTTGFTMILLVPTRILAVLDYRLNYDICYKHALSFQESRLKTIWLNLQIITILYHLVIIRHLLFWRAPCSWEERARGWG